MHGNAVFKGDCTHNGTLLKLHENSYTIGYSSILNPAGTQAGTVKFGDGVFIDANQKNNKVYVGAPTALGAVPVFGGIIVREPAIASGYPALNDEVSSFQKGLLCRQGFVVYKKGNICTGTGAIVSDTPLYGKAFPNSCVWVSKSDGKIYFSAKSTIFYASGDILIGRVVENNPDDESVTVYIDPTATADTADIEGATPTIVVGTPTATTIPLTVSNTTGTDIVISYKAHSATDYIVFGTLTPVLNQAGTAYEASATISELVTATQYDIKAESYSACGFKSATGSGTTA